jgi:hypothetical protein
MNLKLCLFLILSYKNTVKDEQIRMLKNQNEVLATNYMKFSKMDREVTSLYKIIS